MNPKILLIKNRIKELEEILKKKDFRIGAEILVRETLKLNRQLLAYLTSQKHIKMENYEWDTSDFVNLSSY